MRDLLAGLMVALCIVTTGCATAARAAHPAARTPYDAKWDDLSTRQCLERGGSPGWRITDDVLAGKPACEGWR